MRPSLSQTGTGLVLGVSPWKAARSAIALLAMACGNDPAASNDQGGVIGGSGALGGYSATTSSCSTCGKGGTASTAAVGSGGTGRTQSSATGGASSAGAATGGIRSTSSGGNSGGSETAGSSFGTITGGQSGTGGSSHGTTTPASGGDATGGKSSTTGGTESSGGTNAIGGKSSATGGTESQGSTNATGGKSSATGGTESQGGTNATGGKSSATGGTESQGGTNATGGTKATGGSRASGGSATATGGTEFQSSNTACNGGEASGGEANGGDTGIGEPPVLVVHPTLAPNDNDAAPLAAMLSIETNLSATATVVVSGGGESWTLNLGNAVIHEQPLLGFKPDTDYTVSVSAAAGDTRVSADPLFWHTPALPDDFPHLEFVQSDPTRMAAGMTMFDVFLERYAVIVDSGGEVRWFYKAPRSYSRYRLLANGNIIGLTNYGSYLTELDWFGNTVNTWYAAGSSAAPAGTIPVAVNNFHHNLDEMPNGNLVVISQETRNVSNYPSSSYDPNSKTANARVNGDQIIEITRAGNVVKRYSLFDIIDPTRIGHDSEINNDWTHSNAVVYDSASDAYLLSMRHQDAVIKIRRETGELVWILGNHANWRTPWQPKLLTPLGDDFEWQYHQHGIELTPGGIGLYDNGNYRAPAYQDPITPFYSRVVRFAINEEEMTVRQLWTYLPHFGDVPLYSYALSDADWQTNGNVLIASGTLTSDRQLPGWAQIVEVTESGDSVFEVDVIDSPSDYTTFDADRIPDIRFMSAQSGN